ncbi:MAG: acylphosphatase [Candidatus Aegiribacteria sp.]|nr:acylphosphatase [Candidatus Aegiribacteria sp.]MBD3294201.1 acylphosphatase [Candidatus Fermentibacteria bacterium]
MKRVRVFVSGRVQGVCFRAYTRQKASELGVDGFVRNLSDGRVEIVAQGEENDVDSLVSWASHGPSYAEVTDVSIEEEPADRELEGFSIKY